MMVEMDEHTHNFLIQVYNAWKMPMADQVLAEDFTAEKEVEGKVLKLQRATDTGVPTWKFYVGCALQCRFRDEYLKSLWEKKYK